MCINNILKMIADMNLVKYCFLFLYIFGQNIGHSLSQNSSKTSAFPDLRVKKCICKADEVLEAAGCKSQTQLTLNLWDKTSSSKTVLNMTNLNYTISPLRNCPPKMIIERFFDWAFVTADGKLINFPYETTDYCIENEINKGETVQKIERCVPKLEVQICCDPDEYMDAFKRCTKIRTQKMVKIASNLLNTFDYTINKNSLPCDPSDIKSELLSLDIGPNDLMHMDEHFRKMTNGSYCLGLYGDENELYLGSTYCASFAQPTGSMIPLCCEPDLAFYEADGGCRNEKEPFALPSNIQWPTDGSIQTYIPLNCSDYLGLHLDQTQNYSFTSNGSLLSESGALIPYGKYCIGAITLSDGSYFSGMSCIQTEVLDIPCAWRWTLKQVSLGISCVFLLVTLIVYIGVQELRQRVGGGCLISELAALLVSQITLIVLQENQSTFTPSECLAAGVIILIFVLASFFWLNIICYNVWSTFRIFRPFSEKIFDLKLFLKYSIYGWGIPVVIGIIAVILETQDLSLKPNFSPTSGCFFTQSSLGLQWFYMYGIILVLLLVNVGFFGHLVYILMSSHIDQKKRLKSSDNATTNQQNKDIENIKLHGKLFIIMGFPWLIEVFTSFASVETECYIWFLDLLNALRGIFIFVIFLCKKSTKDKIVAAWFPTYNTNNSTPSTASRKTSLMSLSSWLPSIHGRKISKVSLASDGNINLGTLKEEENPDAVTDNAK